MLLILLYILFPIGSNYSIKEPISNYKIEYTRLDGTLISDPTIIYHPIDFNPIYRSPSNPQPGEGYSNNGGPIWHWTDSTGIWTWNSNGWYWGKEPKNNWHWNDPSGHHQQNHQSDNSSPNYWWDETHPNAQGDYPWNKNPIPIGSSYILLIFLVMYTIILIGIFHIFDE